MKRALALLAFLTLGCTRVTLEPARYTCSMTATSEQCPGGWRCLPEGFCVDPLRGGAWACTTSSDCTGGWHCGPEARCYDRATATNVACRRGADAVEGNDCADGWTCGLDERCLNTATANDNRCETDVDCFGGQRCSGARCINAMADALRPSSQAPTLVAERAPLRGATRIAAAQMSGRRLQFGFVGDELRWFDIEQNGVGGLDGGPPFHALSWSGPLPREMVVIDSMNGPGVLMLSADGGLEVFSPETRRVRSVSLSFPATGIRATGESASAIAVLGDARLALGTVDHLEVETLDAGLVLDLFVDPNGVLLTTSTGAFTRPYTKPSMTPPSWTPAFCELAPGALRFVRPVAGDNGSELLAVVSDGGTTAVFQYRSSGPPAGLCPTTFGPEGFQLAGKVLEVPLALPLHLMGKGTRMSVAGLSDRGTPTLVWVDGGVSVDALSVSRTLEMVVLDARGRLRREDPTQGALVPLMPAGPPLAVLGPEILFTSAVASKSFIDAPPEKQTCFTRREGSWCRVQTLFREDNVRATRGAPGWLGVAQTTSTTTDIPTFRANVWDVSTSTPLTMQVFSTPAPVYTSAARSSDAGTLVVAGAFDFISWAEVDGRSPTMRVAVSPLPRGEITDVVLASRPPPASEASFAEGWVVSSGRVFRVFASTRALWRSSEVVLPTEVEALRVWLDDSRPRAGDRNGVVFSLDSAVALSDPLPAGQVAAEYASRCNNDFVRTESGRLFQLVAGPGTLGVWREVSGPGPLGHLSDVGGELRVWDAEGTAYWLDGLTCAP